MRTPHKLYFEKASDVPNSPLPALLFRGILAADAAANGWTGLWTDTIYDYTHFHSNAHEVLGIAEGKVTVKLGGEGGRRFRLEAGDMLVLPADIGHCRVGSGEGLKVISAYPPGQSHCNMKRKGHAVSKVPVPSTDPFYGQGGPLVRIWSFHDRDEINRAS